MNTFRLVWKHCKQNFQRIRQGQGMVEFALALPVLLLLMFGVIEGGRLLFFFSSISSASREGARYGAAVGEVSGSTFQFQDCDGIRAAAKRVGVFAGVQDANITIKYDNGPGSTIISNSCPPDERDIKAGSRIVVNVSVPYKPIVPIVPLPSFPIQSQNTHTILRSIYVVNPDGGGTETTTATVTETLTPSPSETITPSETVKPSETVTPTQSTALPSCGTIGIVINSETLNQGKTELTINFKNNGTADAYWTSVGVSWGKNGPMLTRMSFGGANNTLLDGLPASPPEYVERSWDVNSNWRIKPGDSGNLVVYFNSGISGANTVTVKAGFNKQCTLSQ